ncbi:unnamed protein product [Ceratitis capitata]|uniref:(Mediterranean fruit fly) hypothetical protein n=1 Tax=Ceratitis capitata TaxID=7213 RepID=A0A811VHF0_CERCA|nr:unnamed protein product [Ceratitis capitata]
MEAKYGESNEGDNLDEDVYFDWKYDEYVDDTLFDAKNSDEDYHRKELVQDMRRILANGPENTHIKKGLNLVVEEYDYENDDGSQEDGSKFILNSKSRGTKNLTVPMEIGSELREHRNYIIEPTSAAADVKVMSIKENKSSNVFDTQTDGAY